MLLEISSIPFVFGKTYTQVFLRFSAVARPASLANTGFSGLRHLAASSVKITQAGFVPPVLKTVRATAHRGSNPLPSATKETSFVYQGKRGFYCFLGQKQAKIPKKQWLEQSSGPFRPPFFHFQSQKCRLLFGFLCSAKSAAKL